MRENGGISNWEINYIQKFKFLTNEELRQYEQWYLDEYKPELNIKKAYRSHEELKEYNKINCKKWLENNRELNKSKSKEWRKKNPIQKKENDKKYYQKNKEKLKEKIPCPYCNKEMRKDCIKRHIKTQHPTSI